MPGGGGGAGGVVVVTGGSGKAKKRQKTIGQRQQAAAVATLSPLTSWHSGTPQPVVGTGLVVKPGSEEKSGNDDSIYSPVSSTVAALVPFGA